MVMQLKSCCCGCSLKTGTVIIGVLSAIGALICLILCILGAAMGTGQFQKEFTFNQDTSKEVDVNTIATAVTVICVIFAIVNAIHLILAIMLIYGASAESAGLVKPWIVYAIVSLVIQTILTVVSIIIAFVGGGTLSGVLGLVGLAISLSLEVYFILVVNSFHTQVM